MKSLWKDWSANGIRIPLLGVATLLLIAAAVTGVMGYRNWDLSNRNAALTGSLADARRKESDCAAAIKAGTDFLLAANNFSYNKPDEWTPKMASLSSGAIHDYFANAQVAHDNSELIKAGRLVKSATVADAACAAQAGTGVRVIAQLDEQTQNFQTPDPVKTTSAVWVELTKVDGVWKAADSGRGDQALAGNVSGVAQPPGPQSPANPSLPATPR
ncbi:hypothetical protein ACFXHA_11535 [Nocardia sp. NPDC059240]|uniref:hypothetical protein n=1 Tax=Nocardia sp. NPDC059240 TaxID=3346786 RepID=UPI0036CAB534